MLNRSLGFIAGIGEFDPESGQLVQRIKEGVFGELSTPVVDQTGIFEIEVSIGELAAAGVNSSNYLGVFFHHDDNGVLFQDATDDNENRNDVYLVSDLALVRLAQEVDSDLDGMPDSFENDFGLNANDSNDAAGDLDKDGLANGVEFLFGSRPDVASVVFLPGVEADASSARVSVSSADVIGGRVYILEWSPDLGVAQPWKIVDSRSVSIGEAGTAISFARSEPGFYRIRVELAR